MPDPLAFMDQVVVVLRLCSSCGQWMPPYDPQPDDRPEDVVCDPCVMADFAEHG